MTGKVDANGRKHAPEGDARGGGRYEVERASEAEIVNSAGMKRIDDLARMSVMVREMRRMQTGQFLSHVTAVIEGNHPGTEAVKVDLSWGHVYAVAGNSQSTVDFGIVPFPAVTAADLQADGYPVQNDNDAIQTFPLDRLRHDAHINSMPTEAHRINVEQHLTEMNGLAGAEAVRRIGLVQLPDNADTVRIRVRDDINLDFTVADRDGSEVTLTDLQRRHLGFAAMGVSGSQLSAAYEANPDLFDVELDDDEYAIIYLGD